MSRCGRPATGRWPDASWRPGLRARPTRTTSTRPSSGLLREVGDRISTAIERARLEQALTRRADEAELLQARSLLAASGEDESGRILGQHAGAAARACSTSPAVRSPWSKSYDLLSRWPPGPSSQTPAIGQRLAAWPWHDLGRILTTGETVPEQRSCRPKDCARLSGEDETRCSAPILAVPLIWRGAPFGLLEIDSLRAKYAFRQSEDRPSDAGRASRPASAARSSWRAYFTPPKSNSGVRTSTRRARPARSDPRRMRRWASRSSTPKTC